MHRRSFIQHVGSFFVGAVLAPQLQLPTFGERTEPVWNPIPDDIEPYVWHSDLREMSNQDITVESIMVTAVYRQAGMAHGSIAIWAGNLIISTLDAVNAENLSALYRVKRDNLLASMRHACRQGHRPGQLETRLPVTEQKLDNGLYVGELAQLQWLPIDYLKWLRLEEYGRLKELIPFPVEGHPYGARETRYLEASDGVSL